jgi:signal transduction histidine kinase
VLGSVAPGRDAPPTVPGAPLSGTAAAAPPATPSFPDPAFAPRPWLPLLALLVVVLVSLGSAWSVASSQRALRDASVARAVERTDLHARFIGAHLAELDHLRAEGVDLGEPPGVSETLDRFLQLAVPARGTARLLLDDRGAPRSVQGPLPASVAGSLDTGTLPAQGWVGRGADTRFVIQRELPGSDWSVVLAIPEPELTAGMRGWAGAAPWVVWSLLTLAGLVAVVAIGRLERQRALLAAQRAAVVDANRRLERSNAELARSNTELEQFAYLASHDLQEPLRKIASYSQLVQRRYRDQLDDDAEEFLGYAVDGATRMQQLISDLLAYSRVGRTDLDLRSVDLDRLLRSVRADLQLRIDETGARVELPRRLPAVEGDEGLLRQLLQNLVDNALKFHGPRPPVVRVTATVGGDRVHLVIADEGIGIPPEQAERVLGLFQRLHARSEYPGTGLGLAICHRIVERHGGTIELRPGRPHGTEVHLELPRAREVGG